MINPDEITTVRVGQLPPANFNLTDLIPHEVGTVLSQGTAQSFADFIGNYLETTGSIAFRAITVLDGQTLPDTTEPEWILAGKGTFVNVNGGADITTTEELNALMSNGAYWFIGVEIPIVIDPLTITGFVKNIYAKRYAGSGQTYTLPTGATATKGWINDYPQHLEEAGFESDLNTFTQTGTTFTFKQTIETGDRIIIDYYS